MAYYFASDTHLRLDRPERSERFADFVNGLNPTDTLIIVGDLYDFWFVSRQQFRYQDECPGLQSLVRFRKAGGHLRVLAGNHDHWLNRFIKSKLGVPLEYEPIRLDIDGIKIQAVHGHLLIRRHHWKALMESKWFMTAFSWIPSFIARRCKSVLDNKNRADYERRNRVQSALFRQFVDKHQGLADVFIFGHVHDRMDEQVGNARLFILGSWMKSGSYLMIENGHVSLVVLGH